MKVLITGKVVAMCLIVSALLPGRADTVSAQNRADPLVRVSRKDSAAFHGTMKAVSAQANVAFVAEESPYKATLSLEELKEVPEGAAPLSIVVGKLAAAYDYDAKRRGDAFVLHKRFTDPDDLPGVTLEECYQAMEDVLRVLAPFNPGAVVPPGGGHPLAREVFRVLTAEQVKALEAGLPVSHLTPRQRAQVWRVALSFYLQDALDDMNGVAKEMRHVSTEDPVFRWGELQGMRLFGYETLRGPQRKPFHMPLSNPAQVYAGPRAITFETGPAGEDPTDPVPSDRLKKDGGPSVTLADAIADLSARRGTRGKAVVDEALATKRVTLIGAESVPPEQVLSALADLYGLRLKSEENGVLRLTRRLFRITSNLSALPDAIRQVFPEPLLRALSAREKARKQQENKNRPKEGVGGATEKPSGVRWSPTGLLRIAAVRRLRSLAEPKIQMAQDGRVPLSKVGEEGAAAFAVALMVNCLDVVRRIENERAPYFITDFDRIILTGGLHPGRDGTPKFSLFLSRKMPDGRLDRGVGFAHSNYRN